MNPYEFKTNLLYIVSSRAGGATQRDSVWGTGEGEKERKDWGQGKATNPQTTEGNLEEELGVMDQQGRRMLD